MNELSDEELSYPLLLKGWGVDLYQLDEGINEPAGVDEIR